ncbi:MAG: NAD(P)H-hydrate dehydratase [Burkholderiales bacterium]|nr:NAD(P)H-hydrate dehydratase [Burkholderiales bacterium]
MPLRDLLRENERAAVPLRICAESGPWPLHGSAAAKALEALALAGRAGGELMEHAGLGVARLARALAPSAGLVEIWCGPGNNGGDGYVAARRLHQAGTAVRVRECGVPGRLPADAAQARRRAQDAGVALGSPAQAQGDAAVPPDLVVDALLGLGTTRAPEGVLADAIGRIGAASASGALVLAVDLPSGLHPDTGQPLGDAVVRADHTLALLSLKPGLFTAHGRDLAGTVWFDRLGHRGGGVPGDAARPTAWLAGPSRRAALPHASHKGRRGDAWVVGGAGGMLGAAALAARAALAAGAGRVYVSLLARDERSDLDPIRPELMHRPFEAASAQLLEGCTAIVGCGGGEAVRECLPRLLAKAPRLVLDADALNHIAGAPELQRLLRGRAERGQASVLTPHPLEAARMLGTGSAAVQADRLAAATTLAQHSAAVVVLKGSGTVVAAPAGLPRINPTGNAALATAGTGDVLAGWLGGLWAQAPGSDAFEVACAAVWQHGHAADVARPFTENRGAPLLAGDLITALASSA